MITSDIKPINLLGILRNIYNTLLRTDSSIRQVIEKLFINLTLE